MSLRLEPVRRPAVSVIIPTFNAGPLVTQALRAQELLAKEHDVSANVWSATSYQQLRGDALECERWNRLHPEEPKREPFVVRYSLARHELCFPTRRVMMRLPPYPPQVTAMLPHCLLMQ